MPEDLGVTEIGGVCGHDHWIPGILCKCTSVVQAVGYALGLVVSVGSVHCNKGVFAKSGGIVLVHDGATAENGAKGVRSNGYAKILPVYKVL